MIIVYYAGYRHILPTIDATHTDAYLDLKEVTLHFHYDPISDMITLHSDVELTPYSTQPLTDDHASIYLIDEQRITIHCVNATHYALYGNSYSVNQTMISIGSDTDNDIVIALPWLAGKHGYINLNDHTVHGAFISVNHQYENGSFKNYDVIDIDGLTMVIHDQTISIMDSDLINVHLNDQPSTLMANQRYPLTITHTIHQHTRHYVPVTLKQTIPNVFLEQPSFHVPIWVTMGPMLIMGIASFASAALMAYQRYWQGYDLSDSLPSMVLPLVLILSTLIFQPLNRLFEKRRAKAASKKRFDDFELQWSAMRQSGEAAYARFKSNLDAFYPSTAALIDQFDSTMVHAYTKDNEALTIRLGSGIVDTHFVIDGMDQYMTQPLLYDRLCEYQQSLSSAFGAKLLDLTKEDTIKLIDGSNHLYHLFMIQLITNYADDQIKIAYLIHPSFLKNHPESLSNPYTFDQNQWLVFFEPASLVQYAQQCDYRLIVFSQMYLDRFFDATIIYLDQADVPSDVALVLDDDQLKVYGPTMNDHYHVESLPSTFDLLTLIDHWFPTQPPKPHSMDILSANNWYPVSIEHYRQICAIHDPTIALKAGFASDEHGLFMLDLSESGDGPHGLLAGTTGSGKSECALALMVSLALRYSPQKVNFLVVDFKGSALASQLSTLPHYVGTLDNLSVNEVNRFLAALTYETKKRQKMLLDAAEKTGTSVSGIDQYRMLCMRHTALPNMAHLVVLIDEFAELKAQVPEFIDAIMSLARIGRSLGIHLILSTQKPNGVINDQILANTRFRICLKVNERADSMEMLNSAIASQLKQPGEFYCVKDQGIIHGQSFYLNGCYDPNHVNIHGSIMDLTRLTTRQVHLIKNQETYMDTIIPIIKATYPAMEWLLKPAVQVRDFTIMDHSGETIRLGEYDDPSTMMVHIYGLTMAFTRLLFVGSTPFCTNLIHGVLVQLEHEQILKDTLVVIISDNVHVDGCECIHNMDITRIEMVLTTLVKVKMENVVLIIDGVDDLVRSNPNINDLLILLDNQKSIRMVLTMHHGNGALLRNFTKFDATIVDAQCDITIKSLFFSSLKYVSETKEGFGYTIGLNEPIAMYHFQSCASITDSHRRIADPSVPFIMDKDCFAKAYYTNIAYPLKPRMVFTASSMMRLNRLRNTIEQLDSGLTISDHYDPSSLAFMPLAAFNDAEMHYLYETTPVIFAGGGIHQQFIFPFGKFEENDTDDAIYIHGSTMVKLRLGVSYDDLHPSFTQ